MSWSIFKQGMREGFNGYPLPKDGQELMPVEYRQVLAAYVERDVQHQRELAEARQQDPALAEYREVLAAYVERDAQHQRTMADAGQRIAALEAELAQVTATRDRYQANGKRISAEKREIEFALRLPGVLHAARKAAQVATHPDRGRTDSERRALTEAFQRTTALFNRIGQGT